MCVYYSLPLEMIHSIDCICDAHKRECGAEQQRNVQGFLKCKNSDKVAN